jgi:hypothetical protein
MIKPLRVASWLRHFCVALMLCSAATVSSLSSAQETATGSRRPASDSRINLDPRTNGANLVHGNYCGLGNRPGKSPIDALDVACMHHDACTPPSGIPDCDCNIQLREEAAAVARDPRQPADVQIMASMIESAASVMICKPIINRAAAPPAPVPARPRNVPPADIPPADIPTANVPAANVPAANVPAASTPTATVPTTAPATPVSIVPPAAAPAAAAPEAATAAPMDIAPAAVAPATEAPANGAPVNDAPVSSDPLPIAPAPRAP